MFLFYKRSPTCPACCIPDLARTSPHPSHISGKRTAYICSEKDQKWQRKPQFFTDPFALRYCVAKRYTSDDSFLLASGFTVLVFWNSCVSLLCKRWL